jgi:glycosyltransferase involved in cell wall biosynthesis
MISIGLGCAAKPTQNARKSTRSYGSETEFAGVQPLTCSVIIATRNRPDLLRSALESVLGQSAPPKQLIIIDDCSDEDVATTVSVCDRSDVEFHYCRLSSRAGAAVARNEGAARASGDVLMFLDDDDIWEPSKIETQLRLLSAHDEVGAVYTGMLAIDRTNGKMLSASRHHHSGIGWPQILFRNFIGPTSAVAVRQLLFREVGGFDPDLKALQDYDLWLRLCMRTPVLFDGAHNLRFGAVSNSVERISFDISNYEAAFEHIQKKYCTQLAELQPRQARRFLAQVKLLLTSKYLQQGRHLAAGMLLVQGIALYPPTIFRVLSSLANSLSSKCPERLE